MTKEKTPEGETVDPAIATDVDGDGILDFDPEKVQATIIDLVKLDYALREHGTSIADILRQAAWSSKGILGV